MARDMMTSISDVPQLYQLWGTRVHVPDGVSGYLYQVPRYPCTWDLGTGYHCTRYPIPGHLGTHVPGTLYRGTLVHVPDGVPGYLCQVPCQAGTHVPGTWYRGTQVQVPDKSATSGITKGSTTIVILLVFPEAVPPNFVWLHTSILRCQRPASREYRAKDQRIGTRSCGGGG